VSVRRGGGEKGVASALFLANLAQLGQRHCILAALINTL